MPDTTNNKHLRLIMPPGIGHALRTLSLKEGRSESSMAVRLIAEAIDARNIAAQSQPEDVKRFVTPNDRRQVRGDRTGGRSVISATELRLLLNAVSADERAGNIDGLSDLLRRGLVAALTEGDAIVAITTTTKGESTLNA